MSNFTCGHCGTEIVEDDAGYYTTKCEHYPRRLTNVAKRLKKDQPIRCLWIKREMS